MLHAISLKARRPCLFTAVIRPKIIFGAKSLKIGLLPLLLELINLRRILDAILFKHIRPMPLLDFGRLHGIGLSISLKKSYSRIFLYILAIRGALFGTILMRIPHLFICEQFSTCLASFAFIQSILGKPIGSLLVLHPRLNPDKHCQIGVDILFFLQQMKQPLSF